MAANLQPVRGTHDLLGDEMRLHRHIVETTREVAALYGCDEAMPPVFEFSEVFHRAVGESSDIVSKETYSFTDRGGEMLTLRPEFTAGIVRAFLTSGQTQTLPWKAFYAGPAFRYERPQKGRLRQFHQIGIEMIGVSEPASDVEAIACGWRMLKALGLSEIVTLEINSLGDVESRGSYRTALVEYFLDHREKLSEDSRRRLEVNPLRILDSKDEGDRALFGGAPDMRAHFGEAALRWIDTVEEGLSVLGIPYKLSPRLVRGLDYYSHTVFEFTTDQIGAQGTVLAGGRYDGLIALMGGADIPGVGFAAGIERLALLMETRGHRAQPLTPPVVVIEAGEKLSADTLALAEALRAAGQAVELVVHKNIGKAMKKADRWGARHVVIIGEEERISGMATLRDMRGGEQEHVAREHLAALIGERG